MKLKIKEVTTSVHQIGFTDNVKSYKVFIKRWFRPFRVVYKRKGIINNFESRIRASALVRNIQRRRTSVVK